MCHAVWRKCFWGWTQCSIILSTCCCCCCLCGWLCCWRWSRPYIFACVICFFSEGVVQFLHTETNTNQVMPWDEKENHAVVTPVTSLYCIFIFYFVRENNIKWPFQTRTLCLITENNLLNILLCSSYSQCPERTGVSDVLCFNSSLLLAFCAFCILWVTINSVVH